MVAVGMGMVAVGMGQEIENFCEKWMGYLMRPRPPPNLAGVSFRLCLVCLGAGLSAWANCGHGANLFKLCVQVHVFVE